MFFVLEPACWLGFYFSKQIKFYIPGNSFTYLVIIFWESTRTVGAQSGCRLPSLVRVRHQAHLFQVAREGGNKFKNPTQHNACSRASTPSPHSHGQHSLCEGSIPDVPTPSTSKLPKRGGSGGERRCARARAKSSRAEGRRERRNKKRMESEGAVPSSSSSSPADETRVWCHDCRASFGVPAVALDLDEPRCPRCTGPFIEIHEEDVASAAQATTTRTTTTTTTTGDSRGGRVGVDTTATNHTQEAGGRGGSGETTSGANANVHVQLGSDAQRDDVMRATRQILQHLSMGPTTLVDLTGPGGGDFQNAPGGGFLGEAPTLSHCK